MTTLTAEKYGQAKIVELGAGAGNTVFPIMARNRNLFLTVHALDFSKTAIDLIRQNPDYDGLKIRADVWDLASESPPEGCEAGTVDVVLMIFVFSALSPDQWSAAVKNVFRMLKPGGTVLYRDYGRGDLTQVRLKKGRYLMENFYIRGDGTRVYYFEKDELIKIWSQPAHALEIQDIGVDRRMLVNRKKELKMYRAWIQGVFRKPDILRCAAPPACEVENA